MSRPEKEVALEQELADVKEGYELLDRGWSRIHELAMGAVRTALKMPEGTVPELVAEIERLQRIEEAAKPVLANMIGTCSEDCQEPSFAGFMHGACVKHSEEYDMPVGALNDQTLLTNLRTALEKTPG